MASSHKTEHYGLSQFAPLDRPAWLVDYNTDMEKIDKELWNISQEGGGGGTLDQVARDMAQAAQDTAKDAQGMATAAQATADEALEKAEEALNQQGTITGDITNINEEITQIKNDVNTAQSTATTANETAEEALTLAQGCVKRSGDTMTGVLKLAGNPVDDADAANKGYVDSLVKGEIPEDMPEDFAQYIPSGFKFLAKTNMTSSAGGFTGQPEIDTDIAPRINELFFIARVTNNSGSDGSFVDNGDGGYALETIVSGVNNWIATAKGNIGERRAGPTYYYGSMVLWSGTQFKLYQIVSNNGTECTVRIWCHGITLTSEVFVFWR